MDCQSRTSVSRGFWIAVGLACLLAPIPAQADTLHATDDAFTTPNPAANRGNNAVVRVQRNLVGNERRGFVRFDFSALPAGTGGADVDRATLRLFSTSFANFAPGRVSLHALSIPWTEATLTRGNEESPLPAPFATGVLIGSENDVVSVDVTAVVQGWIDSPGSNNGIAIVPEEVLNVRFASKESASQSHPMELEVVTLYTDADAIAAVPPGFTGYERIPFSTTTTVNSGQILILTATCSAGKKVLGGGALELIPGSGPPTPSFRLYASFPTGTPPGWEARWVNESLGPLNVSASVEAICAQAP